MKARLLIWAVTLLMVVGAVLLLARRESAAGQGDSGRTREELFEFAGRMDDRLGAFERRLADVGDSLPATPEADSVRQTAAGELADCRALLDSVRMTADIEQGVRLRDRLELEYAGARDWLRRLEALAGIAEEETIGN
ncbi:hypothetical protein JXB37_06890 [candidate division WOR-3 bacterium]|nr:hypothetical protein [candidate division WOR-3 bacterium]